MVNDKAYFTHRIGRIGIATRPSAQLASKAITL